jgi:hypothetical protein
MGVLILFYFNGGNPSVAMHDFSNKAACEHALGFRRRSGLPHLISRPSWSPSPGRPLSLRTYWCGGDHKNGNNQPQVHVTRPAMTTPNPKKVTK